MLGILSAGTANIKAYLYGALIAIFLAMAGTIYWLYDDVQKYKADLAVKEQQLATAKSLIAKMTGAAEISDSVDLFIDTGISVLINEHEKIEDQLRKDYEAYLMETRKEEMCKDYCQPIIQDSFCPVKPNGGTNGTPKPPVPKSEDVIKKKMLEAMWKNFCLSNRTAEGCQQ